MNRRNRFAFDAQPDDELERTRKVLAFMRERLSADDFKEFSAMLVVDGLAGLAKALDGMGQGAGRPDRSVPRDDDSMSLAAMDSALRGRIARRRAEGDRLADAHAASIGITRPRVLS